MIDDPIGTGFAQKPFCSLFFVCFIPFIVVFFSFLFLFCINEEIKGVIGKPKRQYGEAEKPNGGAERAYAEA